MHVKFLIRVPFSKELPKLLKFLYLISPLLRLSSHLFGDFRVLLPCGVVLPHRIFDVLLEDFQLLFLLLVCFQLDQPTSELILGLAALIDLLPELHCLLLEKT